MRNELEKGGAILFVLTIFTSAVNYLFQILAGRVLSVADFGTFNVVLSVILIAGVPGSSLQLLVSKKSAELKGLSQDEKLSALMRQTLKYISIFILLFVIISFVASMIIRIADIKLVSLTIITIVFLYYQYMFIGVAQGVQRFVIMSSFGLSTALFKIVGEIVAIILLLDNRNQLYFILSVMAVGTALGLCVGYWFLQKQFVAVKIKSIFASRAKDKLFSFVFIRKVLTANLSIMFMMNIDIFLVRWLYKDYTAGLYSTAMLFGRIAFFATSGLISAMYPIVAKNCANNMDSLYLYKKTLHYCIAIVVLIALPIIFFNKLIIVTLYGERYLDSIQYIAFSYIIAVITSLNFLNMNYLLAINNTRLLIISLIAGCALCVYLPVILKGDITLTLIILASVSFMVFAIVSFNIRSSSKKLNKEV